MNPDRYDYGSASIRRPDTAAGGVEGRYIYPVPVLKVPEESEGNVWVRTRCWRKVFILQSGWLR